MVAELLLAQVAVDQAVVEVAPALVLVAQAAHPEGQVAVLPVCLLLTLFIILLTLAISSCFSQCHPLQPQGQAVRPVDLRAVVVLVLQGGLVLPVAVV